MKAEIVENPQGNVITMGSMTHGQVGIICEGAMIPEYVGLPVLCIEDDGDRAVYQIGAKSEGARWSGRPSMKVRILQLGETLKLTL